MLCLDDHQVTAYVERELDEAAWAATVIHLDSCERCLALTCALAATMADEAATPPVSLETIETIDRYELREMIGHGATGAVYAAHDPRLGRVIALKVVRTERARDPAVRAVLSREARAMAQVADPHVVAVHDAGELPDGVFLAMELVRGTDLAAWQRAATRSWREVVAAYLAAARGLAAAHAAGIVHRDFKPANVMVAQSGRIAVGDFGLAAARDELAVEAGVRIGTPRYMSPEALDGARLDASADQFSFAIALYEALYGVPPYRGKTPGELRAAMREPIAPPPTGDGDVPPAALRAALVRALAVTPALRWPSMAALGEALEAALVVTRRSRARWVIGGLVIVAAAIAITVAALHARQPGGPTVAATGRVRLAVPPFANATGDPLLDDTLDLVVGTQLARSTRADVVYGLALEGFAASRGVTVPAIDALRIMLAANGTPLVVVRGAIARRGTGYELSLAARDPRLPRDVAATARAASREEIARVAVTLANQLRDALGDANEETEPLTTSLAALHDFAVAQHLEQQGDHVHAAERLHTAIAADPQFVQAHAVLGDVFYNLSEHALAITELDRAVALAGRMGERDRFTLMGDYYGAVGRYSESIAAYQQLLAKYPDDSRTQINVTATAIDALSWPLAVELARNAASAHPENPVARMNLVIAELGDERIADAIRDGEAMLREVPHPADFGLCALFAADALDGRRDAAMAVLASLRAQNAPLAAVATAELAIFEATAPGAAAQLDTALAGLAALFAQYPPEESRTEHLLASRVWLARANLPDAGRDRPARLAQAAAEATLARGSGAPRPEYLAAHTLLVTTGLPDADALVAAWTTHEAPEWRCLGHVLAGDLALARGHAGAALQEYASAEQHAAPWILHLRRAAAQRVLGDVAAALREDAWLAAHRGEAALFLSPSLSLVSPAPTATRPSGSR